LTTLYPQPPGRARAFTVIEVSVTIIIITMLTGLVMVMANRAIRGARRDAERQVLIALKKSITAFETEFGFVPPLADDAIGIFGGQPAAVGNTPDGLARLQGFVSPNLGALPITGETRFSINALQYYLMGLCPVDGAPGSAFTRPNADGTFAKRGKAYDSFYDASSQSKRIQTDPSGTAIFNDRWGSPIRYYRWEPRPGFATAAPGTPDARLRTLVPRAAGDPRLDVKVRGARYALVILGEDKLTDDGAPIEVGNGMEPPVSGAAADDIVEVEE